MLPCNSIEAALRLPYTGLPPLPSLPSPPIPDYPLQQQQHVSRWLAKREQRQYKILRVVYTNSNTVANKRQPGPVKGRGNECTLFPLPCLPPLAALPHPLQLFFVPFRLQFLYCCKMFSFQRSYIYFAHTQKVVCSPFNRPPPYSLPPYLFFIPSLACLLQPFSNAAKHSRCHCSLRLCRIY